MSEQPLELLEAGAPEGDLSIVMLHGLGADGHDLAGLVPHLEAGLSAPARFVLPHAPVRSVTLNAGMAMRAWYDIDPDAGPDAATAEIEASARQAAALVRNEQQRGLPPERIVLGGFSQGGVIAVQAALGHLRTRPAGVIALSTYVHDPEGLTAIAAMHAAETPVFMAHGLDDPMIPVARAAQGRKALMALGARVEWHEYSMGHEICLEEIKHLIVWLNHRLTS